MFSLSSSTLFYVLCSVFERVFFFLRSVLYLYLLYVSSVLFVALLILRKVWLFYSSAYLYKYNFI